MHTKSLLKLVSFVLTSIISYKFGATNQIMVVSSTATPLERRVEVVNEPLVQESVDEIKPMEIPKIKVLESLPISPENLNSFASVSKIIDFFDETIVEEKMLSIFGATEGVDDTKLFLKKIAEEYFEGDSLVDSDLVGDTSAFISTSANKNITAIDDLQIQQGQEKIRLFAHLELDDNYLENLSAVFVKWRNLNTGEVLLFTRKSINIESQSNWVSFIPSGGWREGDYEVKFFKFSDTFMPLAKVEYTIH